MPYGAASRGRTAVAAALSLACLQFAACAPLGPAPTARYPVTSGPARPPPAPRSAPPVLLPSLADLPGWREEDHLEAFRAYQAGCGVARDPGLLAICAEARRLTPLDERQAERFFETVFRPEVIPGPGLLTAYFAPEYPARREPDASFSAPVRGVPPDMVLTDPELTAPTPIDPTATEPVPTSPPLRKIPMLSLDGQLQPYPDRTAIELVPPAEPLAWMRPEDLFFLQIEGSGELLFPNGQRMKAVYAGDNGQPFVPIASPMVRQGLLAPDHASGDAIHAWLAAHNGPQAQAVMDLDPRYVFFSLQPDDGRDPLGAAGVSLPPGRAIAVDPAWNGYGGLYWIDAVSPILAGATKTYRRLVLALDTGSAIKGPARADLYLGRGAAAGREAGRVRHTLLLVRLVPVSAALRASEDDESVAPQR